MKKSDQLHVAADYIIFPEQSPYTQNLLQFQQVKIKCRSDSCQERVTEGN